MRSAAIQDDSHGPLGLAGDPPYLEALSSTDRMRSSEFLGTPLSPVARTPSAHDFPPEPFWHWNSGCAREVPLIRATRQRHLNASLRSVLKMRAGTTPERVEDARGLHTFLVGVQPGRQDQPGR